MGEIADQMIDDMIDGWFDNRFDEFRPRKKQRKPWKNSKGEWKCSDVSIIKISNMSMSHIENTIAFLKKRDEFNPKIQELQEEMIRRYQDEHV